MGWIIPTIKGILIGIGSAATLGAAGTGALAAVIGGAIVVAASIAAKNIMGLFEVEMPKVDTDRSRQATVKSTTEPYKIIYGQTLVSGPIAFVGTANTDNKDLYYAIALAGHEVNDITDMHFDDVVIPDSEIGGGASSGGNVTGSGIFGPKNSKTIVKINKYLGTSTQTADSDLTTAFSGWTSAHTGKGIAYIVTKWTLDEDSQETWDKYTPQNIKALVQGKKLYDPRLEYAAVSTYGQDTTNASYIAYGDNPALCLVDYLINADYGMGIVASKIDWPAVVTAANGCDVSVSVPGSTTEKRFTCNGVLFGTDSHRTNINKILSSMNGNLSYVNGKYIMRAGIYEAPAISLNEDDLISGLSIKTSLERGDRFNTIKGVFIDPSQNYKSTEFPEVQLADAVTRDNGEVLDKEIALNMTNSSYMAQRISNKLIQLSDQQKVVTFPANLSAMRVAVGDRVQVSIDELSWSNKVFQCLGWTFSEEGGVNLTLREDSSTSYADPAVGDYSTITATGDITAGFRGVPSPSGLSATAGLKNVELDWVNPPNNKDFETIYVYASPNGNFSSAVKIGETDGTQFVHDFANGVDAVSPGDTRYYWVRAIRYVGTSSEARSNLEPNADPNTTVYATVGRVEWSDVSGSTNAPEDNATVGATLGVDLYDIDDTSVLLDSGVRNQTIVDIELEDITAGSFVIGVTYVITSIGTTDFTLIGASANTVGLVFTATGVGSGTGTASNRGIVETESNDNLSVQTVGEVGVYTYTQVTALGAQYSVKIDNNGRIAGFGLSSTLPTDTTDPAFSEFYVIADKFQIVDPASTANTPIQPFTVTAQKIRLGTDVEVSGDLVTLGTISSDRIDVSGVITAGSIITTGSTIANDIRIGSGESVFSADELGIYLGSETFGSAEFSVTPEGVLTATSATITGTVTADTFTLSSGATLTDADDQISNTNNNAFFRFETTAGGDDVSAPDNTTFNSQFGRNPRTNDVLVVVNTTSSPEVSTMYVYSGSAWVEKSDFFTGDILVDGTLTATKIKGDVTETYGLQYYGNNFSLSGSYQTVLEFSIPQPSLSLTKRNFIALDLNFSASINSGAGSTDEVTFVSVLQRKSKAQSALNLGTVATASAVSNNVQTITITGDVTEQIGLIGRLDNTSDGSYRPGIIVGVWFDGTSTNVQLFAFSGAVFSASDTAFYSPDGFYTSGFWVTCSPNINSSLYVIEGGSVQYVTVPFNFYLSQSNTKTDLRIRSYYSSGVNVATIYFNYLKGSIGNMT